MNYDDILKQQEQKESNIEVPLLTEEELRKWHKQKYIELEKTRRALLKEQIPHLQAIATEGKSDKLVEITGTVVRSIMTNELTQETATDIVYSDLSAEDRAFFSKEKYSRINNLHTKVLKEENIKELLTESVVDLRKVAKKTKPSDYIDNVLNPKVQSDITSRLLEAEKSIAFLMLAQKENESKFNQLGNALLVQEEKLKALAVLGVDRKKIELYRISLEEPNLTRQQLAERIGKTKPTVITWLKEIEALKQG